MKTKAILSAILSIFILAEAVCAYQEIIDLGALDGYPGSCAWAVNDEGRIVGWADINSVDSRACVFDNTGGGANTNLGGIGSGALSSNSSQIVGETNDLACIFDSNGSGANVILGTLGGENSCAQSINDSGQITGWALDSLDFWHGCIFDNTGGGINTDLGTLGGLISEALSNKSQIVGYADNSFNYEHACIFDPTGDSNNNTDLGALGGDSSLAWSTNRSGQVVGWALNSSGNYRACLFDNTGGGNNIDLGTLGDGNDSEAYCINDKGRIVGYATNSSGEPVACLFDKTGGGNNTNLNNLIDPNSGWTLMYAFGINNDGWIVGKGINSLGQTHAFLLMPELPIKAKISISPCVLDLRSCGRWIICYIRLPKGFNVADIDPDSILLEDEIEAEWTMVVKRWNYMIVRFNRPAVEDIVSPGRVELTVSGELTNGRKFEGTDTIRVINKCKHKHKYPKWHKKCSRR